MNKSNIALLAAAAAAMLTPICSTAGAADDARIRALETRFAAAVIARDLDAIMSVYSPEVFVFDVAPPRQYVGAPAYRDDWKGFLAGYSGPVRFEITDLAVSSQGSLGYGHSIQHVSGKDPQGNPVDLTVRVSDVYRRRGAVWQIVLEHVSVPVNLTTGKADLTSRP
jgi:ketosteroid isomerase-like protein